MMVCLTQVFGFTSERDAKEVIDAIRDCPEEVTPPFPPGTFLNMLEAFICALTFRTTCWRESAGTRPWRLLDHVAGVFVKDAGVIEDVRIVT